MEQIKKESGWILHWYKGPSTVIRCNGKFYKTFLTHYKIKDLMFLRDREFVKIF